ncbi:adenosine receptor A3-like [Montipora foliosa]|uniref:adenosine receptor A3-like n=1 Tax=Montipora foliosa TaxID=591990 RepID=UPI0035F1A075
MSMNANLTEIVGKKTYLEYVCSERFTVGIDHHLIFLSTFVVFLSMFTSLGNALILVALRKESTLGSPSKLLLRTLATLDFCVGMPGDPLYAIFLVSAINEHWRVCYYAFSLTVLINSALCTVSLLTTCAISVDRLLALSLGIRYRETVTVKRVYRIVITFWVLSIAVSAVYLKSPKIATRFIQTVFFSCLSASMFSHTMIFFNLRQHRTRVQDRRSHEDPPIACSRLRSEVSIAKHKKAVSSVLWVQLALLICYLPYSVIITLRNIKGELSQTLLLSEQYAIVFALVNSSLNPLLYCWKIIEVRQAVLATLKKWHCSSTD